jgi:hypothetical protein
VHTSFIDSLLVELFDGAHAPALGCGSPILKLSARGQPTERLHFSRDRDRLANGHGLGEPNAEQVHPTITEVTDAICYGLGALLPIAVDRESSESSICLDLAIVEILPRLTMISRVKLGRSAAGNTGV